METRLLIVDQNIITRRSLAHQLLHGGCEFVEAENLLQASQAAKRYEIEVALIDLESLRSEALLVLQMIKHVQPDSEVILLTGTETIPLAIQGMKLGAYDDLMTPVNIEELLSKIRSARNRIKKRKKKTGKDSPFNNLERPVKKPPEKEHKNGKI